MQRKKFNAPLEIKSLDEGGIFEGYASVFGVEDAHGDVIVKGAFKKTIEMRKASNRMPKMLWQHDTNMIIGKWIDMYEDDNGLFVKGSFILEVSQAREAYALMKAGQLDAMSVGFNIPGENGWGESGRVITEVDLWEISLVTWGANPDALITSVKSIRDFEHFLREAGYSKSQAVAIASKGFRAAFGSNNGDEQGDLDPDVLQSLKNLSLTLRG